MVKRKNAYQIFFGILLLLILFQDRSSAQIVIGAPNLGFSQACASETFNTYSTTFVFSPEENLTPTNQFTIELSDADGDFSNPTELYTSPTGTITTSPATLNFSIPSITAGENYKIRIKSSSPAATSSNSASFPAYYKPHDEPFTINSLISSGAFCMGGSYLLTIDNPGTGFNDSPLNYPGLTFNWYRETGPTTAGFVAQSPTLTVSVEGTYFVETNYGSCTSNSFSNRVTISEVTSGESQAGISSSAGNPFCPSQGPTILTTIGASNYQWFKDGVAIENATAQTYETSESGNYAVQVDLGDCSATGSIELISELFDFEINVSEFNTIEEGETISVFVTTTAVNPVYEWYFNDQLISGATGDQYDITEIGDYKIVITDNSGCDGSREFAFKVSDPFPEVPRIPNLVSPNSDGINDTWMIPTKYVSGTNTEVVIMTNRGEIVLRTNDYLNNWPDQSLDVLSFDPVFYYVITKGSEILKGSITILK